jgi:hypothetical protein
MVPDEELSPEELAEIEEIQKMSKEEVDARLKELGIEVDVEAAMKRINEEALRRMLAKGNA